MLVVSETKSRKVRRVPLPPGFRHELRLRVGKLVSFTSSGDFNRKVRKFSGLHRFHVHQLRHTFACEWIARGGSLAALQQILGHASVVTTQRYARLSDAHVRAEAERIAGQVAAGVAAANSQAIDAHHVPSFKTGSNWLLGRLVTMTSARPSRPGARAAPSGGSVTRPRSSTPPRSCCGGTVRRAARWSGCSRASPSRPGTS